MDSITTVPTPYNEPVLGYAPGSPERAALDAQLKAYSEAEPIDLLGLYDTRRPGSGESIDVTMPSDRHHVLGRVAQTTHADAQAAIDKACSQQGDWARLDFDSRAAVFLRAADLITGKYRAHMNAATMLGQGKTVQQAEIDCVCELADFLRYNVEYARQIHRVQPASTPAVWNRADYRPLEGFVYAITPFNFTSIAGNLPTAPAIMGNVAVWKPAVTQMFAAHLFMDVLAEAGLPEGVITLVAGHGSATSDVALADPRLAGIHFTGSTRVFQGLWGAVGQNIANYRTYPRIVGETGGKDFILAHPSADPAGTVTAIVRGSFEYSGQKCSAASRAYVAKSVWEKIVGDLAEVTNGLKVGDVRDHANFTSAVIDSRAFAKLRAAIDEAKKSPTSEIVAGGTCDDSDGWFVRPTIVKSSDPNSAGFTTEYFGPLMTVFVYADTEWDSVLDLVDSTSPYALTGAVLSTDRAAIAGATDRLRQAAGNFYINDKPTGAVINQQPFGGSRASGTNDKAGSLWNMMRWTSPRSIKEALTVPTVIGYPHMEG
ncbi:MAG: L-glutamate gamma-semialdehyde dehydrogenase [Propionibacteriaceae bacterium]|jgi:1-pyrroline-5-carboxylate dehydrogenase|nr:L-glutamate gamma-semialdehyde dehydrogenase [Propionibacteriaceae bacterium]